ncbi:MAG: acyl-CoA dehydrogenase family protein [Tepidimonas sp.]|uniref:acyl-CoA dehydrogenase family protein n=1 Tax=Tepidimonas sp. TaxID=2002775 RepID=UPI00298F3818|nr:acyl-CoA dehydrogenase family protein [Tepidimonas sp.]MDW8337006.1 acyl-CoA dehydrogenase family protein [Tepidimonas sp.]
MTQPYRPDPEAAARWLLDVLGALDVWRELPPLAEHADAALTRQVLQEAATFVHEVVAPLNRSGDEIGARWHDGQVTMPPGFREAYRAFWQAGWPALSAPVELGGQGLPMALEFVLYEWLSAANHAWTMAPGLLHGAVECLRHHASAGLQARYLPKLVSGEWLATMALTEPQAGSDLGLVRTRATPAGDGTYRLEGSKIFISGGEHDLTDNIVHLVLARLPEAPAGAKGLSLLLAPKWRPDGQRNAIVCERIEDKMGLHGSPTCVLRFDGAKAWLVGSPHQGLGAMFVMMNAARLHVALQGIGLLDAAWQKAHAYALQRCQMRAPQRRDPTQPADPIIAHPAVQRLLDTQRAWIDTGRLLAYRTALALDVAQHHPDAARRQAAQRWCALATPVLKAAWTEQAFHGASDCLQVFGGHGYVREWGIEQIVRDARVTMIYEGTNEIQAHDLLLRKTLPDAGAALAGVLLELQDDLPPASPWQAGVQRLQALLARLAAADAGTQAALHPVAGDFLRAVALTLMGWARQRLGRADAAWDAQVGRAFDRWVWPEQAWRCEMVERALGEPPPLP